MTQPYLALITPIGSGYPDQGLPQPQPPTTGTPPGVNWPTFPSNPIAPGGLPGAPSHPIAPGGQPPYPSTGPGFPTNPIAPGGQPPIGVVPLPPGINIPVFPSNPIAPGGPQPGIDNSLPGDQPGVMNPIAGAFILVWSPQYGWILVAQGGGVSQGPSGEKPDQSLPGAQPGIDNTLPAPEAQPKKK